MLEPVFFQIAALGLGLAFLAGGVHKLAKPASFAASIADYALTPQAAVRPAAYILALAETAAAAAMISLYGPAQRVGLAILAVMFAVYAAAIGINLLRNRTDIDCGCLGFGPKSRLSWAMVARNISLATIALLTAIAPVASRGMLWIDWISVVGGALVFVLSYGALDVLIALSSRVDDGRRTA